MRSDKAAARARSAGAALDLMGFEWAMAAVLDGMALSLLDIVRNPSALQFLLEHHAEKLGAVAQAVEALEFAIDPRLEGKRTRRRAKRN